MNAIDVVVPIFNAADDVQRCLLALRENLPGFARVWLYDDASTDEAIARTCRNFVEQIGERARWVRNTANLGFVGNVNRAFTDTKNDVVLLNSDTIVTQGWLQALARFATLDRVASITPWSNNAEICSFPHFCQNNPVPEDLNRVAHAVQHLGAPEQAIELPTGVGFCMYMSRAALMRIGGFDQSTFGRGYGEENDWCQRAQAWGYRNVFCQQAYVAHVGGRSFSATGEKPGGENLKRLLARYPHYHDQVAAFIARDPLANWRRQLKTALEKT
jgi:GT2 family glycosyltransferase